MQFTTYQEFDVYDVRQSFDKEPPHYQHCPMCAEPLTTDKIHQSAYAKHFASITTMPVVDTMLYQCTHCQWWAIRESGADYEIPGGDWDFLVAGSIKQWDLSSREVPLAILKRYFAQSKDKFAFKVLDSLVFEKLIAECLRYEYQPCEVHHVGARGGSGDGGVDIYLIKDEVEWLIQVKRRIVDSPEPVATIRSLNGVLLREGKQKGMVITSAPSFTRNSHRETEIQTPGAYCVNLKDRGDILTMLAQLPREIDAPWHEALMKNSLHDNAKLLSEDYKRLFEETPTSPSILLSDR